MVNNILIARALGPTLKGEYSSVTAVYQVVIYLTMFGITSSIIFSASKSEERAKKVAFHLSIFTITNGSFAALILIILALTNNPFNQNITPEYLLYYSPVAIISIGSIYLNGLFLSKQLIREMNFLNILSSIVTTVGILVLISTHIISIKNLIILNILGSFLIFIIYLYITITQVGFTFSFDPHLFREMLTISYKSYLIGLMAYIIVKSDIVLLNILKGNYDVGIYTIASGLSTKILLIPQTAGTLLKPRAIKDVEGTLPFQMKISRLISFMLMLILISSSFLIYPAVKLLYGVPYLPSVTPYLLLLPGIFFYGLTNQITPYYVAKGYPAVTLIAPFIAMISNIGLNILLIPKYGYNAAAITSSISYFLLFAVYYIDFYRREKVSLRELLIPTREDTRELKNRLLETGLMKRLKKS